MRISTFTGNQDELFLVIVHFSVRRISRQIICTAYYFSGSAHSFFVSWMSNVIALLDIFHVYSVAKRIVKAAWPCIDPWFFFLDVLESEILVHDSIISFENGLLVLFLLPGTGKRINDCRILSRRLWRSIAYAYEKENCSCWTSCEGKVWWCILVPFLEDSLIFPFE